MAVECDFPVGGLIGDRWQLLGAQNGPLGCPLGPETDLAPMRGRHQAFAGGTIAFSAHQEMVVSVFRVEDEACFEWALVPGSQLHYDYFRMDVHYRPHPGVGFAGHGHANVKHHDAKRGKFWVALQGPGGYAFIVKGCDNPAVGAEHSHQSWTAPIHLTVPHGADLIDARWRLFGGAEGPLGVPAGPAKATAQNTIQRYERGVIAAFPQYGPDMSVAAWKNGNSLEVRWGHVSAIASQSTVVELFNLDIGVGAEHTERIVPSLLYEFDWAYNGGTSGRVTLWPSRTAVEWNTPGSPRHYLVRISDSAGRVVELPIVFTHTAIDARLESPPLDGTPHHAYAGHRARIDDVAEHFIRTHPFSRRTAHTSEDITFQLIAYLHAMSKDAAHRATGQLPSSVLVAILLREIKVGQMGTKKDYDMVLKGLMTILFRYRNLLTAGQVAFILDELVPYGHLGPHDAWVEIHTEKYAGFIFRGPETENHQLMIESCRFLVNQIRFEQTGNPAYHSLDLGLTDWLLKFMHDIAKHDFLEFNSRSYQRLSTHALLNLFEFSTDFTIKTAARNLLDYASAKFAVSSSRLRHLGPFRRQKENLNRLDHDDFNLLYTKFGHPYTGFFLAYLGPIDPQGNPEWWFPDGWAAEALLAGLSSYRPPAAAYLLAATTYPPEQHTFYHGRRRVYVEGEQADGGVEIYYKSPSFLLSAGGMFLNSGYGSDNVVQTMSGTNGTAIAQSTTLLPAKRNVTFAELIRFDRYTDRGVNTGVHLGFACGANLRIPGVPAEQTGWIFVDHTDSGYLVAAYRTPPGNPESLVTPIESLGCYYAYDRTVPHTPLSFDEFKRITLERNNLPERLDHGGAYQVHTADGHSFTFRLWAVEEKYRARILYMDGTALPETFDTRPLADGKFIRTPQGHNGYVEITHPDCTQPLKLDFHNPIHATRQDLSVSCPQWSTGVSAAYGERARSLYQTGKYGETLQTTLDGLAFFEAASKANPGLSDEPLLRLAGEWVTSAHGAHPHNVAAQLAAAENAWEILRFLAARGGDPVRRLTLAQLLHQLTGLLAYGATNPRRAVPAAELTRALYTGLTGQDHRIAIAESWSSEATIHHVMSIRGTDLDPLLEQAEQRRTAMQALTILAPIASSLPDPALSNHDLRRIGAVFTGLVGTLTFGAADSAPSVTAADHGRAVFSHITDADHRVDVAGLLVSLALRHHEVSFHAGHPDPPAEQVKQRRAAADAMSILTPIAESLPDPDISAHQLQRMADMFNSLTGLLAFGAPPTAALQELVDRAATLRDFIRGLIT